MIEKNSIISAAGFLVLAGLALMLFARAGVGAGFMDSVVQNTIDLSLAQKAQVDTAALIGGMILLPLSFAFIAAFALSDKKIDWAVLGASGALSLVLIIFNGASPTNIAIALGILLSPLVVQYIAVDDANAYKELRPGRIASDAAGKAFLLLSLILAVSVFSVTSGDTSYAEKSVESIVNATLVLAIDGSSTEIKTIPGGEELFKEKMQQVREQVKTMPIFGLIRAYYPYISAITVFAAVQFGALLMVPLAGIFAWVLWKFMGKGNKEID